jgi:hypothetical protein
MRIVVASETYQNYRNDAVSDQLTDFIVRREEFGWVRVNLLISTGVQTEIHRYSLPWRNLEMRFRNNLCKDDSALFSRFLHALYTRQSIIVSPCKPSTTLKWKVQIA